MEDAGSAGAEDAGFAGAEDAGSAGGIGMVDIGSTEWAVTAIIFVGLVHAALEPLLALTK